MSRCAPMFVGRLGTAALLVGGQDGPRGFAARQDWPSALRASVALAAVRDAPASLRLRVNLLSRRFKPRLNSKNKKAGPRRGSALFVLVAGA